MGLIYLRQCFAKQFLYEILISDEIRKVNDYLLIVNKTK